MIVRRCQSAKLAHRERDRRLRSRSPDICPYVPSKSITLFPFIAHGRLSSGTIVSLQPMSMDDADAVVRAIAQYEDDLLAGPTGEDG